MSAPTTDPAWYDDGLSVVEQVLFARPPGSFWDRDGLPLELEQWQRLAADADYRLLAVTHFEPALTGGARVTVRTEWAGQELRPVPDLARPPLIWRTDVVGGALDGCRWHAARRPTAHMLHGHVIGRVRELFPRRS